MEPFFNNKKTSIQCSETSYSISKQVGKYFKNTHPVSTDFQKLKPIIAVFHEVIEWLKKNIPLVDFRNLKYRSVNMI